MSSVNFWDISVWDSLITIAILFIAILLATAMCRLIKPFRHSLLPMPVIAGFIILAVILIYNLCTPENAEPLLNTPFLEALTYHGLGIGFVAIALKHPQKQQNKRKHNTDVVNAGLVTVSGYLIQGILGLAITLGLSYFISDVYAPSGLILPMGYGQGPGQAFIWGKNYAEYGFTNGASFGLAISSCGFVASAIGGAVYLGILRRRRGVKLDRDAVVTEHITNTQRVSSNVDHMTVQVALVLVVYMFTYLVMEGLRQLFLLSGVEFLMNTVNSLIWGFNFLLGMVFGMLARTIIIRIENKKNIEIVDDTLMTRLSGTAFDIMIVASIGAINLVAFTQPSFILPLLLLCITGGVVTYWQVNISCKLLFPQYRHEAFLSLYGMLTGTASTGMILLRQIDNQYGTPAAGNLVFQSIYAILFGFPLLLLMGFAPRQDLGANGWAWVSLAIMVAMMAVYTLILFRKFIFKKKTPHMQGDIIQENDANE